MLLSETGLWCCIGRQLVDSDLPVIGVHLFGNSRRRTTHTHIQNKMSAKPEIPLRLLAPLAITGLMDSISYMVTAPSIVFYVLANGGSYESYGIILSSFSFSAFLFKPILGYWCDRSKKYRLPYIVSLSVASLGGLTYFLASYFDDSRTALALILLGRLLGGVGQANSTLGE